MTVGQPKNNDQSQVSASSMEGGLKRLFFFAENFTDPNAIQYSTHKYTYSEKALVRLEIQKKNLTTFTFPGLLVKLNQKGKNNSRYTV